MVRSKFGKEEEGYCLKGDMFALLFYRPDTTAYSDNMPSNGLKMEIATIG